MLAVRAWVALFVAVSAVLVAAGYFYYRMEAGRINRREFENLATIAGMKAEQIEHWREERIADTVRSAAGPMLIKCVRTLLEGTGDPVFKSDLLQVLDANRRRGEYVSILILANDGKPVASIPEGIPVPDEPHTRELIARTAARQAPQISDLFRAADGSICLDTTAPIYDGAGKAFGIVLQRSDASLKLFPLIQSWPTSSPSAEALLIYFDGNDVVFLNELRHRSRTALSLRVPMGQEFRPAVQAVKGRRGIFKGADYRGKEVLSDLRPIAHSPWFMVTKIDTGEILAEARYRAYVTGIVVGFAILLSGSVIGYAHRRRQAGIYQELFESERQKRLNREQFRATLYSIGDGIITTDVESRVRKMNRVAEELTGWTENEARGRLLEEVFNIVNQETRSAVVNPVGKVLGEGIIIGLANHTLLIARDGTERAIADSAAPIRDDRGNVNGVVLVFSDVTEKYRVEAALKKGEREYRQLFESMLNGFALHDIILDGGGKPVDYRFVSVNPAFEKITGLSAEKVIGRTVMEVMPGIDAYWIERYGRVALTGEPLHIDEYSTALGRYFEVAAFSPQKGRFAAVFADITERKLAESALRASELRFRSLLQNVSSISVRGFGPDRKALYWNKAAESLFGYASEEVLGRNMLDFLFSSQARKQIGQCDLAKFARTGEPPSTQELCLKRKDGTLVTVISSLAAVETADGGVEFFAFDIDITERKRLEAQILRNQRMESIGTLASGVAHDLNNILAPIILSIDMLRNETDASVRQGLIDTIETCAQRGAHVVNQVITFARGAKGEKATIQPRHLILEMEKIVRETFPGGITVASHLPGDLWPVKANATQIHQVLLNLSINARDAMPKGGTLTFAARNETVGSGDAALIADARPGCYAVIEISDTGAGIAPEIIGKIFDPFFTTKDVGKGTGLGLSTVLGIIRGHDGFIAVTSEKGRGSTFRIFLPADLKTAASPVERPAERRRGAGETILLVDDDLPVCRIVGSVLRTHGYKVIQVTDALEALSIFKERQGEIDLLLTDMSMPGMDGAELIREIQAIAPKLKIIVSSGHASEESREKLGRVGVQTILSKPYDTEKLLADIARVLGA